MYLLSMSEFDFLKAEPSHGPSYRPQSIEEVTYVKPSRDLALKTLYVPARSRFWSSREDLSELEVAKSCFRLRTELLCQSME